MDTDTTDTDTSTPLIILENHIIQGKYMCWCRVGVGHDT